MIVRMYEEAYVKSRMDGDPMEDPRLVNMRQIVLELDVYKSMFEDHFM